MSIPINNIEHYFDENLVLIAENILENKLVHNLSKHDQGVWTAEVQAYEVELQIKSSKLVAFTCECHKGTEGCSHVVASLMLLRRQIIQKNLEKQERKERSFIPNKLNITAILKQVSDEDIREFVREYARADKKLSTALKAAFIHKVDVVDDNKYLNYLKSILPSKDYKNPSFNSGRKLLNAYKTLLKGTADCFVLGEFLEVWNCVSAILTFHYPLSDKLNIQKHDFEPVIIEAIQLLSKTYLNTNAIELKERIEAFTTDEIAKVHYRLESNAFIYWLKLLFKFDNPETDRISELCQQIMVKDDLDINKKATVFTLYIGLIKKWKQLKNLKNWIKSQYLSPSLLLKTSENLFMQDKPKDAKWLLKQINKAIYSKEEIMLLRKGLFETEIQSEQFEDAIKTGIECFKLNPEGIYFKRLLESTPEDFAMSFKPLFTQEIESINDLLLKTRMHCEFAIAENDFSRLIEYLKDYNDLNLYMQFLDHIPNTFNDEHKDLITILLKKYLEEHFGEKPIIKVRNLLKQYAINGNNELRSITEAFIQKNYASRKNLIDEILYY